MKQRQKRPTLFSHKSFVRNRKGDIPITILVMGVVAICALAIYSFYFSTRSVGNDFRVLDVLEEASILQEKFSFYEKNTVLSGEEIEELFDIRRDPRTGGRYLYLEQNSVSVRYNIP